MPMSYLFITLNQQRRRELNDEQMQDILRLALANGWRPWAHRVHGEELRLDGTLDEIEGMELAAALERGLKRQSSSLHPSFMIAVMETIGVLRHSAAQLLIND